MGIDFATENQGSEFHLGSISSYLKKEKFLCLNNM